MSAAPHPATGNPRPIDVAIALHRERIAAHYAAMHPAPTYPSPVIRQTVTAQGKFAYDTVNRGLTMATASPVRNVGVSYAKLTLAGETQKVGGAYLHAVFHGNGKEINQLSRTSLSKKVAKSFSKLSESPAVKHVGQAFTRFGHAVADQFNKYFAAKPSKPSTKKA